MYQEKKITKMDYNLTELISNEDVHCTCITSVKNSLQNEIYVTYTVSILKHLSVTLLVQHV